MTGTFILSSIVPSNQTVHGAMEVREMLLAHASSVTCVTTTSFSFNSFMSVRPYSQRMLIPRRRLQPFPLLRYSTPFSANRHTSIPTFILLSLCTFWIISFPEAQPKNPKYASDHSLLLRVYVFPTVITVTMHSSISTSYDADRVDGRDAVLI